MVFYFQPFGYGPGRDDYLVYMGRDKFENEDLIKYGLPLDIWFHVSDLSSAHVYLRLPQGCSIDSIPPETLEDCVQLVKANSIQGNKQNCVDIVYTPWTNLKKTAAMAVGQVSFHDERAVKKTTVAKRSNDIINRLNRTKREETPDLAGEREAFDREVRAAKKADVQAQRRAEKSAKEAAKREQEERSYDHVMQKESMVSRDEVKSFQEYEDDFM